MKTLNNLTNDCTYLDMHFPHELFIIAHGICKKNL